MSNNFIFLLKTYHDDFAYIGRLLESFHFYNKEHILLYIVVSNGEKEEFIKIFSHYLNTDILLFEEDEVCSYLTYEGYSNLSVGYLNQEIVKLSFWENGYASNYCCIDSETVFIRDFYYKDFMFNKAEPYTVLVEDNDLHSDPVYNASFWKDRMKHIQKIEDALDFHPYKLLTCHGYQIMSSIVLKDFKEKFMVPSKLAYIDLLKMAPLEFSWYNLWIQKEQVIPIHFCEPMFKTFHMRHHCTNAWLCGIKECDWAQGYVGYILQSNFFQNNRMMCYEDIKKVLFLFSSDRLCYGVRSIFFSCVIQSKYVIEEVVRKILGRR